MLRTPVLVGLVEVAYIIFGVSQGQAQFFSCKTESVIID